jgi:GT2 family glycosyltransferase
MRNSASAETHKVGVLLLNWNGGEFTIPCIHSLLAMSYPPWRILVWDNGSTDGSPDRIAQMFPQACVLQSPTNIGCSAGNNAGIRRLLEEGAEYVWVLNNDTVVDRECLSALLHEMQTDPGVAVATGKILYSTPPHLIWYAGADWKPWLLTVRHRGQLNPDRGRYDQPADVEFVSGCCMLIRRSAFEAVGLFDERFFFYHEDVDWCLRASQAGLRLRYVPQAVLWHKASASLHKNTLGTSGGVTSPWGYFLTFRNGLFIIRKYADHWWQRDTALAYLMGTALYLSIGFILLWRLKKLSSLWQGIYCGLKEDWTSDNAPDGSRSASANA